ncbi:hypothetical protein RAA17_16025 [Komagataeibacter rhaeticus]|nr:hypothetical protein [Komagataeibacter rhaeticus]
MKKKGLWRQGVLRVGNGRQFFQHDVDLFQRGLGLCRGIRGDGGNGLAQMADPVMRKGRLILHDNAIGVFAPDIAGSHDGVDAGHCLGFGNINRNNAGMGNGCAQDTTGQHGHAVIGVPDDRCDNAGPQIFAGMSGR